MTFYVGIDYSITAPAVCLMPHDSDNFFECEFLCVCQKKFEDISLPNITIIEGLGTDHDNITRFRHNAECVIDFILDRQIENVCIEDYAYAAKGKVFHIGENCGILKLGLRENEIDYSVVAPTAVKRLATGKGNADKTKMYDAFEDKTGANLFDMLNMKRTKKIPHPIEDIVDAYYIAKYAKTI